MLQDFLTVLLEAITIVTIAIFALDLNGTKKS